MPPHSAWICNLGTVEYEATADLQRGLRDARERGDIPDTLLVLEHDPVITTGHRTEPSEVAYAKTTDIPVMSTDRGGKATYHGPGQVVAYPIFALADHGEDVKAFVRRLEQAIINTLERGGIVAGRRCEYPGVWTGEALARCGETVEGDVGTSLRKIASIGLRVTRWVSFHGIALNVNCDLEPFTWFTPCGIPDAVMTSVAQELGHDVDFAQWRTWLSEELVRTFELKPETVAPAALERATVYA